MFVGYPISGRPVESPLITLEDSSQGIEDDAAYLISSVTRRALALRGVEAVEVLFVGEWSRAALSDVIPGPAPSRSAADVALRAIRDEIQSDMPMLHSVLAPFAGAPALPGAGAGINTTFGAAMVDHDVLARAAETLEPLLPPWTAGHRFPSWGGSSKVAPTYTPYTVGLSSQPEVGWDMLDHPAGADTSALIYQGAQPTTVLDMIFGADLPALRTRDEIQALSLVQPRREALVEPIDLLVRLHTVDPSPPTEQEMVDGLREGRHEVEEAAVMLLEGSKIGQGEARRMVRAGPSLVNGLLRGALYEARLEARAEVGRADLLAAAKAFSDSAATYLREASSTELRRLVVAADVDLSVAERRRRFAVEGFLRANRGATVEDVWQLVAGKGHFDSREDLEQYLDRLQLQGHLVELSGGRYEWIS